MKDNARKKNGIKVFVIVSVICFIVFLLTAAGSSTYTYKAVFDFSLYAEKDFSSEKKADVPQNVQVELVGEAETVGDFVWQKVRYNGTEGYTLRDNLYVSSRNDNYDFTVAKAKSRTMGEGIGLYENHTDRSQPVRYMNDGESLRIVEDGISYGKFLRVEYNGTYYYVLADQVTTGLSYNQTLAVIILGSVSGVTIVVLLIVFSIRRRQKRI